ncbi:beta-ketoacyl-ACP synthase II [Clostridium aminobutyricum]|uniref:3-oxoacyl-[acyl-carrier-protein] synthase 2 n=1 Tax=Clostridium aminobutyricum TaxID=33953 RepID=A0A939D8D4_CLOAM|nr:beta-ketoacyl-ACP synthase II [Clostridium aminobutyricum]MBN7772995.1 beta-ketoacyl-ACP synthase II [Clostridium aminobutyricum]
MDKRVVITGLGAVAPVGNNADDFWEGIRNGKNGIDKITLFDTTYQKAIMGGEVKGFEYEDKRAAKRLDRHCQFGLTAAKEAIKDSGIVSGENVDPFRFGVIAGTGIGGIMTLEAETRKAAQKEEDKAYSRVSALLVPMVIPNILAGNLSIEFNAKATSIGLVTACAAGTHSIGEAYRSIKHGYTDAMLAGAAEAAFAPVCFAGFANMTALSTRTDKDRCSTPFDKERDGFVMGEGSGFLILEELEHALARGAKIYGEIVGYGTTCDAYHVTSPSPSGDGAAAAMQMAIAEAGIKPEQVDYINAHGTGTPYNDAFETIAIKSVFGPDTKVPISSTKSMTGHLLGAAGAIEAVICTKALGDDFIPPTINYKVPDEELDLDYVPNVGKSKELNYVLSNSLGFGGHNGTILIKKFTK